MRNPFKNLVISTTGYFGEDREDKKIKNWVESNGGTYTRHISQAVTHLVCSKEHYKKKAPLVKEALGIPEIKIVTFDWLEDSLHNRAPKRVNGYLLKKLVKERGEKKEHNKEIRRDNMKKNQGHHIYRDSTGFPYDVEISRLDLHTNAMEKFEIRLWETHGSPCLYACSATHTIPGAPRDITRVLAPSASHFEIAFSSFKGFFTEKTMVDWDTRLEASEVNNSYAFEYIKPKFGPYGKLPGDDEKELLTRLQEEAYEVENDDKYNSAGTETAARHSDEDHSKKVAVDLTLEVEEGTKPESVPELESRTMIIEV